ncbi:hypothetical protein PWP93_30490 [Paraburkholderia sp. A1RI-2L]|uniref:hypothetical protein n=1 Tax=Paraburkholderia sp. A1RI-2L TaxID=3028367 RepID=UPI003B7A075C
MFVDGEQIADVSQERIAMHQISVAEVESVIGNDGFPGRDRGLRASSGPEISVLRCCVGIFEHRLEVR